MENLKNKFKTLIDLKEFSLFGYTIVFNLIEDLDGYVTVDSVWKFVYTYQFIFNNEFINLFHARSFVFWKWIAHIVIYKEV